MKDESPQKQLVAKIKSVNNILVTVSRSPNVDQLTAALGLTMALNKLGKRSVVVFSGKIPREIHFLNPEKTFENNADSLRDFIISLSKDKADRLKARPDGDFVKIYITPYRTKITADDLKFTDGDFNIELIIAIGVGVRDELDASIASHGKIFHNAVTATLNLTKLRDVLGMISWQDDRLGCYAEMCCNLVSSLGDGGRSLIDESVATAFLTGVVSATDQFRNKVTSPAIMALAADLMSQGADQQLITTQLETEEDHEPTQPKTVSDGLELDQTNADEDADESPAQDQTVTLAVDRSDQQLEPPVAELVKEADGDKFDYGLQESRHELAKQNSTEALQAAQAKLLEDKGTITGESITIKPPEAETAETPPVEQTPATSPVAPAELTPLPANDNYSQTPPTAELTDQSMARVSVVPPAGSDSSGGQTQRYVEDPLAHLNGLATVTDGTTMPTDSGSYLIEDNEPRPASQSAGEVPVADLPFNQPNQVSPLDQLNGEPSLTQPMPMTNASNASPTGDTSAVPSSLPPLPPLPPAPTELGPMPPANVPTFSPPLQPSFQSAAPELAAAPMVEPVMMTAQPVQSVPPEQLAQPLSVNSSAIPNEPTEPNFATAPLTSTAPSPVASDPGQFVLPS